MSAMYNIILPSVSIGCGINLWSLYNVRISLTFTITRKKYPDSSWTFLLDYLFTYKIENHNYQLLDDFQYMYPGLL